MFISTIGVMPLKHLILERLFNINKLFQVSKIEVSFISFLSKDCIIKVKFLLENQN